MFPILEKQWLKLREITSEGAQDIFNCFSNNEAVHFKEQTEPASQKNSFPTKDDTTKNSSIRNNAPNLQRFIAFFFFNQIIYIKTFILNLSMPLSIGSH